MSSSLPPVYPVYRFNGTNVHDWIFRISQFFIYHPTHEEERIAIASSYFDGAALAWYRWMYTNHQIASWAQFLSALEIRFASVFKEIHPIPLALPLHSDSEFASNSIIDSTLVFSTNVDSDFDSDDAAFEKCDLSSQSSDSNSDFTPDLVSVTDSGGDSSDGMINVSATRSHRFSTLMNLAEEVVMLVCAFTDWDSCILLNSRWLPQLIDLRCVVTIPIELPQCDPPDLVPVPPPPLPPPWPPHSPSVTCSAFFSAAIHVIVVGSDESTLVIPHLCEFLVHNACNMFERLPEQAVATCPSLIAGGTRLVLHLVIIGPVYQVFHVGLKDGKDTFSNYAHIPYGEHSDEELIKLLGHYTCSTSTLLTAGFTIFLALLTIDKMPSLSSPDLSIYQDFSKYERSNENHSMVDCYISFCATIEALTCMLGPLVASQEWKPANGDLVLLMNYIGNFVILGPNSNFKTPCSNTSVEHVFHTWILSAQSTPTSGSMLHGLGSSYFDPTTLFNRGLDDIAAEPRTVKNTAEFFHILKAASFPQQEHQWGPSGLGNASLAVGSSQFKQWDPGKFVHGENFYNLEDKVDF